MNFLLFSSSDTQILFLVFQIWLGISVVNVLLSIYNYYLISNNNLLTKTEFVDKYVNGPDALSVFARCSLGCIPIVQIFVTFFTIKDFIYFFNGSIEISGKNRIRFFRWFEQLNGSNHDYRISQLGIRNEIRQYGKLNKFLFKKYQKHIIEFENFCAGDSLIKIVTGKD
jgi:hypothetical protein